MNRHLREEKTHRRTYDTAAPTGKRPAVFPAMPPALKAVGISLQPGWTFFAAACRALERFPICGERKKATHKTWAEDCRERRITAF